MNLFMRLQQDNPNRHPQMPATYPWEVMQVQDGYTPPGSGWQLISPQDFEAYKTAETARPEYQDYLAAIQAERAQAEALRDAFKRLETRTEYGRKVRLGIVLQNQIEGITVAQSAAFLNKFQEIAALLDNGAFETAYELMDLTPIDAPGGWLTSLRKQFYLMIIDNLKNENYMALQGLEYSGPEGTMMFIGYAV